LHFRRCFLFLILAYLQLTHQAAAAGSPLVILMPGGTGAPKSSDFLIRNRSAFELAGFDTFVSSTAQNAVEAAKSARANGRKIFLVGISFGVDRSVAALASGAPADGAVFYSGAYLFAQSRLGTPNRLPRTLLVHHRSDLCPNTSPANAENFMAWSGGRVAKIVWINSSGGEDLWICGPRGAHGFFMKDREPISAGIAFLKSQL
jgi:dienelactone hydrolase